MQTWLLLYTPDLGSNTFLSLSQGASTLLSSSFPPPVASHLPFSPYTALCPVLVLFLLSVHWPFCFPNLVLCSKSSCFLSDTLAIQCMYTVLYLQVLCNMNVMTADSPVNVGNEPIQASDSENDMCANVCVWLCTCKCVPMCVWVYV